MREEPLTGGRDAREVVRVGDTVRRACEPGSAFAARLLGFLEASGYAIFQDGTPVAFIDWMSCRPGDRLDDLGYMAWTWCIQAAHLRELRDAYGPVRAETLILAMVRSQDRVVRHSEQAVRRSRDPAARRAWADEAIRWATADKELIRAHEQTLLAALR